MDSKHEAIILELKDRQDILDCITRYCRGVDRLDRELLQSCYHPEAWDDHRAYVGPAEGFIDWVLEVYRSQKRCSHHEITNHLCEIDGAVAHAESYFVSTTTNNQGPGYSEARGRYVDRLEKRDGAWKIAERLCLVEMSGHDDSVPAEQLSPTAYPRDRTDPSYQRPLRLARRG